MTQSIEESINEVRKNVEAEIKSGASVGPLLLLLPITDSSCKNKGHCRNSKKQTGRELSMEHSMVVRQVEIQAQFCSFAATACVFRTIKSIMKRRKT